MAKQVGKETEELGKFVNGLRDYLGLDPLHRPGKEAKPLRSRGELEMLRFGVTRPVPWHSSRTPIRGSGT